MKPPTGVLLDVDGTLLDSNRAHARAFADAFREEGLDVDVARVLPLIGMGGDKLLPALGVEAHSRVGVRAARRKKAIFRERYLPTIRPFPGARDLLSMMRARGQKLVVATSAEDDELAGLLRAGGIADLIDDATTSSDAEASKPDPDIVEVAIARAGGDRQTLVMLGDTPYDVEAANRAGVRIVALTTGWSAEELAGAIATYADTAELVANFEASIFAGQSTRPPA